MTTQKYMPFHLHNIDDSRKLMPIKSPYSDQEIGLLYPCSKDEVDESIKRAKAAQNIWKTETVRQRAELLFLWAKQINSSVEEMASILMHEVGKGIDDAIKEIKRTVDFINYTAEEVIHMTGESMRGENFPGGSRKKLAIIERVPLGVVLSIAPFNYPINLAAAKIAPALAAGNSCIFKPATQGSICGWYLVKTLIDAGMPEELVPLITGKGSEIGDYLVQHPLLNFVSFTGGTETGLSIAKKVGMVPIVMELGGKDPAIVFDDVDLELIAKTIVAGGFSYSGQRCTGIKRVIAHKSIIHELTKLLTKEVELLSIGSPEDNCSIVPLIDTKAADYIVELIDDALQKGAVALTGNKREGNIVYPTLLTNVNLNMRVAWEEPFGPVLPIFEFETEEEAVNLANASDYGLQVSIFSRSYDRAFRMSDRLETGTVQINGRPERGPDHFPFIGTKHSGIGVQGIRKSIESMSREKVTILNFE
jgi:glyceraldehyde-3-phosphate dehydrogenase (NADP+)